MVLKLIWGFKKQFFQQLFRIFKVIWISEMEFYEKLLKNMKITCKEMVIS